MPKTEPHYSRNPSLREVFSNNNFLRFWFGQLVSFTGDRIDQMAMIGVLAQAEIMRIHSNGAAMHDPAASAADRANWVTFWATLPYVVLSPVAGVVIDRFNRRHVMMLMDVIRGITVLVLPFVISPGTHPWIIYGVIGAIGAATSFYAPAKSAFVPEIVPHEHLLRANSVTSTMNTITILIGTVIGGLLVDNFGYRPSLILDSFTYFFSALMLLWIGRDLLIHHAVPLAVTHAETGFFRKMHAGMRYVWHRRVPGTCVFLDSWFFIVGGILFAAITKIAYTRLTIPAEMLSHAQTKLGLAYGALGIGMAVGGFTLGRHGDRLPLRALLGGCYAFGALFTFLLAVSHLHAAIYVLIFLVGCSAGGLVVAIETSLQRGVEPGMRGRVFALNNFSLNTMLLFSIFAGTLLLGNRAATAGQMLIAAGVLGVIGASVAFWRISGRTTLANLTPEPPGN